MELSLKWGTIKSYNFKDNIKAQKLIEEYDKLGVSLSAITQKDTLEQKEILYKLIDLCDKIYLEWDGIYVSKEKAKEYVMNYGNSN